MFIKRFLLFFSVLLMSVSTSFAMTGSGTEADPYIITTPSDLSDVNNNLAACYELGNDIDLSGITYGDAVIARVNVAPYTRFSGIFNGNGYDILNLTIGSDLSPVSIGYLGLFGRTHLDAEIKNLNISNSKIYSSVSGLGYIGILCGENAADISNCHVSGLIHTYSASSRIGLLTGYAGSSVVSGCSTTGNITGTHIIGGLIGFVVNSSITDCSSSCTINSGEPLDTVGMADYEFIGGMIGFIDYSDPSYETNVVNCETEAYITLGSYSQVVGLFGGGFNKVSMTNCMATGSIHIGFGIPNTPSRTELNDTNSIGGFCGVIANDSNVSQCGVDADITVQEEDNASSGALSSDGVRFIGGFCGNINNGTLITESYAKGTITIEGVADRIGNFAGMIYNYSGTYGPAVVNCYTETTSMIETVNAGLPLLNGVFSGGFGPGTTDFDKKPKMINCYAKNENTVYNPNVYHYSFCPADYNTPIDPISNCFWDSILCKTSYVTIAGATPTTTANMQTLSTFANAGWDIDDEFDGDSDIWWLPANDYPQLKWKTAIDHSGPYSGGSGTEADPYLIANRKDVLELSENSSDYDKFFKVIANVNMAGDVFSTALIAPDTDNGTVYYQGTSFTGSLNGNGYTISNFTINGGDENEYLGFIGLLADTGEVFDLSIEDCIITTDDNVSFVGGIVSYNQYGNISDCIFDGEIIPGNTTDAIGGICGRNYGEIDRCEAIVSVYNVSNVKVNNFGGISGRNDGIITYSTTSGEIANIANGVAVGGLCGYNYATSTISYCTSDVNMDIESSNFAISVLCGQNSGLIEDCVSTGDLTLGDGSHDAGGICGWNNKGSIERCSYNDAQITGVNNNWAVGGVCGNNVGDSSTAGLLSECYSTSDIVGAYDTGSYGFGGLCGTNTRGVIVDCYATGDVSGNKILGGFCGMNHSTIPSRYILNCYSTGAVAGNSSVSGFCGAQYGVEALISNCLWDTTTSGSTRGVLPNVNDPGTVTNLQGKPTSDMQTFSTFDNAGWDISDMYDDSYTWYMNGYPELIWNY